MALKFLSHIRFTRTHLLSCRRIYLSYSNVADARPCAEGSLSDFESVVRSLERDLQPERLSHVLNSASDSSLALQIFRWASHHKRNVHTVDTYSCMITRLAVSGSRDEMDSLLREMVRLKFPALEQSLNDLVRSLNSENCLDEALLVIQHSSSAKFKLSVSACNSVLHRLVEQGKGLQRFMLAYMEIVKAGVLPDVETLNWLIKALCESGRLDLALIQFERMGKKRCAPNSRTFEILIMALGSQNRVDESLRLFNTLLETRCFPDSSFYAQVMLLFCKFSKFNEVIKLHQMMKGDGIKLNQHLYSMVIRCLCDNKLLDDAVIMFKEMKASGHAPMTSTYVDIVECYCILSRLNEAVSFLEENYATEAEPYNVLLKWLCKNGRLQDSVSYLKKFHSRGLVDNLSWNIVISHFCNEGSIRRASELIGRMVVSSFTIDESTYSAVISCYCRLGLYVEALNMFKRVSVSALTLDLESVSQLVWVLCHMKRMEEAIEVFKYHCKRGQNITSESLDMLIQGTCMAGKVHEVVKLRSLAVCSGISCKFSTYEIILQVLLKLEEEKYVLVLFAQMLMEGYPLDRYTYNSLLRSFLTKATIFEAAILFNKMVNHGFIPDKETFELLVNEMASLSFINMVARSLLKVVNISEEVSSRMYNIIIYGLIKEGFKSEARKFLDQMLEKGWVPDLMTHRALLGRNGGRGARELVEVYQTVDDDNVCGILLEGLH